MIWQTKSTTFPWQIKSISRFSFLLQVIQVISSGNPLLCGKSSPPLFSVMIWHSSSPPLFYGVATVSRLLKMIRLFCKRALQKRPIFSKETYHLKETVRRIDKIIGLFCKRDLYKRRYSAKETYKSMLLTVATPYMCHVTTDWIKRRVQRGVHVYRDVYTSLYPISRDMIHVNVTRYTYSQSVYCY